MNAVGKAVDELQLMTMLNGEYDHSNAILTFHAGTGGTTTAPSSLAAVRFRRCRVLSGHSRGIKTRGRRSFSVTSAARRSRESE